MLAEDICHLTLFVCVNTSSDMAAEVAGYADVAKQIIDLAVFGAAQNRSYTRLADFTDAIGNRVSGSHNLDLAIKYMYNAMTEDGLDVHLGECGPWCVCSENTLQTDNSSCGVSCRASQNPTLGKRG